MNSLIIANNAPNYFNFFIPLSERLRDYGKVTFALDSKFSLDYNSVKDNYYVFSEFCDQQEKSELNENVLKLVEKIQNEYGTWFLYPDFDRDHYYKMFSSKVNLDTYKLFKYLVAFFVELFEKEDIQYVYYENASNALALVAREVARFYNAQFIGLSISRLPGRVSIVDKWESESEKYSAILEKIEPHEMTNDEKSYINNYLSNIEHIQPDYMKNNSLNQVSIFSKYFNLHKFKIVLFKAKYSLSKNEWDFQVGNPIKVALKSFLRNVKRRINLLSLNKYYEEFDASLDEAFYLYPLHYHPEASTSLLAREYESEYEVIRNIAFSLPYGTKLYVKDHMSAAGYLDVAFYNKLQQLPNVRIISPNAPTKLMIKQSIGIITLTSTVGYEALLLNKPVITLGNVFYEFHKNCLKCNALSDIPSLLKTLQQEFILPSNYNQNFVLAYYRGTHNITLNYNNDDKFAQNSTVDQLIKTLGY